MRVGRGSDDKVLPKCLGRSRNTIVAKALDGQWYPLPLCEDMSMCDGERGSGPEGADDLCLVGFEALGMNLSINYRLRLGFEHQGWDCLLYTSPSPRDGLLSRMPSSA